MTTFIRTSCWPSGDGETTFYSEPFTGVVALEDTIFDDAEKYIEYLREHFDGDIFITYDVFEFEGELQSAVMEAAKRANPEIEAQQAIAYHWNGATLPMARQMLTNSGPTPLDVEQTKAVARQLVKHPNYKGQTIQFYIWNEETDQDPKNIRIVTMTNGDIKVD